MSAQIFPLCKPSEQPQLAIVFSFLVSQKPYRKLEGRVQVWELDKGSSF